MSLVLAVSISSFRTPARSLRPSALKVDAAVLRMQASVAEGRAVLTSAGIKVTRAKPRPKAGHSSSPPALSVVSTPASTPPVAKASENEPTPAPEAEPIAA